MHANVHTDRAGGGGGSWRLPPDETLQVADPKQKEEQVRGCAQFSSSDFT